MSNKTRIDTDMILTVMKRYSDRLIPLIAKTGITPNQVTLLNFLIFAPIVCILFFIGGYRNNILALVFLFIHSFFDLIDGELARQKNMLSNLGAWLEDSLDNLLQTLIIFSISLHIIVAYDSPWRYLVILAIFGQSIANNLGLRLTHLFKIDPLTGNEELHKQFKEKHSFFDNFLRNMLVPTDTFYVFFFTLRFYILAGIVLNMLFTFFIFFAFAITIRAVSIYLILTLYHSKNSALSKLHTFRYLNSAREISQ